MDDTEQKECQFLFLDTINKERRRGYSEGQVLDVVDQCGWYHGWHAHGDGRMMGADDGAFDGCRRQFLFLDTTNRERRGDTARGKC